MTTQSTSGAVANQAIMQEMLDAFLGGDMERFAKVLHPEIVWTVPGRSLIAGEHRGVPSVLGFLGRVMELCQGTLRPSVSNIICDDTTAAFVTSDTAERNGKRLDAQLLLVATFRDGQVASIREYIHNLYTWDEFWS